MVPIERPELEMEAQVRSRIDEALASGRLQGPDCVTNQWQLSGSQQSDASEEEADHAPSMADS